MGIMDKAKDLLGKDDAQDKAKEGQDKASGAARSKTDQVSGKANDMMGGTKDRAKGTMDSAATAAKKKAPGGTDKHVDKGSDAAKEGIDRLGS
jgi:hypothetical protein